MSATVGLAGVYERCRKDHQLRHELNRERAKNRAARLKLADTRQALQDAAASLHHQRTLRHDEQTQHTTLLDGLAQLRVQLSPRADDGEQQDASTQGDAVGKGTRQAAVEPEPEPEPQQLQQHEDDDEEEEERRNPVVLPDRFAGHRFDQAELAQLQTQTQTGEVSVQWLERQLAARTELCRTRLVTPGASSRAIQRALERAQLEHKPQGNIFVATDLKWGATRDLEGEALVLAIGAALRTVAMTAANPQASSSQAATSNPRQAHRVDYYGVAALWTDETWSGDAAIFASGQPPSTTAHGSSRTYFGHGGFLAGAHQEIEWKRPAEIGDPTIEPAVFSGDIDPQDIKQGNLGDCYFLAALASCVAGEDDQLLRDLIVEDGEDVGVYGVKLFLNGAWQTIVIDDSFPCVRDAATGYWEPLFAGYGGGHTSGGSGGAGGDGAGETGQPPQKELWPMIFEKAWAKLHGSYEAIEGGETEDALQYLTGGLASRERLDDDDERVKWRRLHGLLGGPEGDKGAGFCSCFLKPSFGDSSAEALHGLIPDHAYSVLKTVIVPGTGERLLQLHNPWGDMEWNGAWSDQDGRWQENPELARALGQLGEDDGNFFMCWEDFRRMFNTVGVCNPWLLLEGATSRCTTIEAGWHAGSTAGSVFVTIYQPDLRGNGKLEKDDDWSEVTLYRLPPPPPPPRSSSSSSGGNGDYRAVLRERRRLPVELLQLESRQGYVRIDLTTASSQPNTHNTTPDAAAAIQKDEANVRVEPVEGGEEELERRPLIECRFVVAAESAGVEGSFWLSAATDDDGGAFELVQLSSLPPDEDEAATMAWQLGAKKKATLFSQRQQPVHDEETEAAGIVARRMRAVKKDVDVMRRELLQLRMDIGALHATQLADTGTLSRAVLASQPWQKPCTAVAATQTTESPATEWSANATQMIRGDAASQALSQSKKLKRLRGQLSAAQHQIMSHAGADVSQNARIRTLNTRVAQGGKERQQLVEEVEQLQRTIAFMRGERSKRRNMSLVCQHSDTGGLALESCKLPYESIRHPRADPLQRDFGARASRLGHSSSLFRPNV